MPDQHDTPVTRKEFTEALDKISVRIEELFRAKQISWPLIIAILTLVGGVLGFGIKNLGDVSGLRETTAGNSQATDDFRERIRALEANGHAIVVENETQNRWMADVANLTASYDDMLRGARCEACAALGRPANSIRFSARTYWPMSQIGGANPVNGSGR